MKRFYAFLSLVLLVLTPGLRAQEDPPQPTESDLQEQVDVALVMVETLVLDSDGRTVPDLTQDDFELIVAGKLRTIDEFDVNCPEGEQGAPQVLQPGQRREPVAPEQERKIVLLLDYYHLGTIDRGVSTRGAAGLILQNKTPGEEVMIAGLANGLRIEQRFTKDTDVLLATLERMDHDASLYAMDFGSGVTDRAFFDNLSTLMDVLGEYEGPKAVVMFSSWMATSADWDTWFWDVAQRATLARAVIYPTWTPGLQAGGPTGGSPSLARLANESGGYFSPYTSDLTWSYARAQRDMACRYTVGFYIDPARAKSTRNVRVRVTRRGMEVRSPEVFKIWSAEEQRESRMRAAFADPTQFEDPLVRAMVYPVRPRSAKEWEVFAAVNFPLPAGSESTSVDVAATIAKATTKTVIRKFRKSIDVDAGDRDRTVTLYGLSELKPGSYILQVVMGRPGSDDLQTATTHFAAPEVPATGLFLRGPALARIDPDGIRLRAGKAESRHEEALDEILGDDAGIEPLVLHQIAPGDELLTLWEACTVDKAFAAPGATVERFVQDGDGRIVHSFEPVPLALEGKKKARCHGALEPLAGGTLSPGRYRVEVQVKQGGELLARGLVPLLVQ